MKIVLQDKTEADNEITLSIAADNSVSGSIQKVLVDDTDGTEQNDGAAQPFEYAATDPNAQAIIAALTPVFTNIANNAGTTGGAASTGDGANTAQASN